MKTGCVNFRQHAPQIDYHSNVPWTSRRNLFYMKPTYPAIFSESLAKINPGIMVETSETCVFWQCVHPPTREQQDLRGYWTTSVHDIFIRRGGIIVDVSATIGVARVSILLKCQHKQRRGMPTCRHLAPQNWLPWQCPLNEVHQILSLSIFFVDGVKRNKSTIRVGCVHPLSNDRVDIKKKKVTSAKHKLAGIAGRANNNNVIIINNNNYFLCGVSYCIYQLRKLKCRARSSLKSVCHLNTCDFSISIIFQLVFLQNFYIEPQSQGRLYVPFWWRWWYWRRQTGRSK